MKDPLENMSENDKLKGCLIWLFIAAFVIALIAAIHWEVKGKKREQDRFRDQMHNHFGGGPR